MLLPTRAIRDEGTSFHYMNPGQLVELDSIFLKEVEKILVNIWEKVLNVKGIGINDNFFYLCRRVRAP